MKPKVITHQPAEPAPAAEPAASAVPGPASGASSVPSVMPSLPSATSVTSSVPSPRTPFGMAPVTPLSGLSQPMAAQRAPQATVIAHGVVSAACAAPAAQQPVRAAQPAPPPSPTTVVPLPQTPPPTGRRAPPSVVPGTIRRGVDVSLPQLAERFPGAAPEALQQAQRLLQDTVVDTLSAAQAARWGDDAQRGYSTLVDASLLIIHSATLQTSLRHVARLHALLAAVAEKWQAPARSSALFFWKTDAGPHAVLQASQGELTQLRQHLSDSLPALRTLQAELQGISAQLAPLAVRLDALSLAAHYLSDAMAGAPGTDPDPRAYALVQRASALSQTVLHIHSGALVRQGSQHSLDALIHRIQDTVLMALPAWMEKVALATQARTLNDTERYALAQQLQGLLGLLHIF